MTRQKIEREVARVLASSVIALAMAVTSENNARADDADVAPSTTAAANSQVVIRVAQSDFGPKVTPLPAPTSKTPVTPPSQPPPVPDPNMLFLGGTPQNPDFAVKPLVWKWRRFTTPDYVLAAAMGAITLGTAIVSPWPRHSLGGPILFDNAVRNALRASDTEVRYTIRDASDVGLSLLATWPLFVDSLITAWWYRGSRDAAEQMALVDLETLAIAGAAQGVTNVLVSRERPYGQLCGTATLPSNSSDCTGSDHYRSFFSGHATFSFTTAALICQEHEKTSSSASRGTPLRAAWVMRPPRPPPRSASSRTCIGQAMSSWDR